MPSKSRELSCPGAATAWQETAPVPHELDRGVWPQPRGLPFRERGGASLGRLVGPKGGTRVSRCWLSTDFCSTGGPGERHWPWVSPPAVQSCGPVASRWWSPLTWPRSRSRCCRCLRSRWRQALGLS